MLLGYTGEGMPNVLNRAGGRRAAVVPTSNKAKPQAQPTCQYPAKDPTSDVERMKVTLYS